MMRSRLTLVLSLFTTVTVAAAAMPVSTSSRVAQPSLPASCAVSPSGPVEIMVGDFQGFYGGSACAGHAVGVVPKGGAVGVDGCTANGITLGSHGAFFAEGCEEGEAEIRIYNGGTLVQTIEIEVIPASE